MDYAEITLRPADPEDMPFLLKLRQQTMNLHFLAPDLIPSSKGPRTHTRCSYRNEI